MPLLPRTHKRHEGERVFEHGVEYVGAWVRGYVVG